MHETKTRHVAVFGDVHGHLRLMFRLCQLWQIEHAVHLDAILQCGDLGFFPDPLRLDKATRRFADRDPEELGFWRYFSLPEPPERDDMLDRILMGPPDDLHTVRCPAVWCHGNHEDFQGLAAVVGRETLVPVDAFRTLYWLRSGCVTEVGGTRVAALGGGPEAGAEGNGPAERDPWRWVDPRACTQLSGTRFDVLLTHGAPAEMGGESDRFGSRRIREVIELTQPAYCFFAHHRDPIPPGRIGRAQCFWLNDVGFHGSARRGDAPVASGCMGLLSCSEGDGLGFTPVDEPWFRELNSSNWRSV